MSLYTAYTLFSVTLIGTEAKTRLLFIGEAAASLLFAAALVLYLILIGIELKRTAVLLFPVFSIVFLTAPLFIVNPIQSRCFFPTYLCFVWLLAELVLLFFERTDRRNAASICKKCCALISAAAFFFFLIIYGSIYRAEQNRLDTVRKEAAAGATEIFLPKLPYASFTWLPDPETGTIWEKRFKLFHHLPKDVTIVTDFVGE